MSISVFGIGAIPLLEAIPGSFEKSDLLKFAFGPEPISQLIAWETVTLKIDFICSAPNFLLAWSGACVSILCRRMNGASLRLQSHIFRALQCHTGVLPFKLIAHDLSMGTLDIFPQRVTARESRHRGYNDDAVGSEAKPHTGGGWCVRKAKSDTDSS
jgi:hypothetical protein